MPDSNQRNLVADAPPRYGTVALVGQTNVGKSTFLNAVLGEPLAIVSPLPQTTRDALLGVMHRGHCQIAFLDTPGLHRPRSELGRRMNAVAWDAARHTDVLVFMTDTRTLLSRKGPPSGDLLAPEDRGLISALPPSIPTIALVNKVDLLRDKSRLLPLLAALESCHQFEALVPISVTRNDGMDRALDEIEARLPEGPGPYDDDALTDKPTHFFVREYIREQILNSTAREVPHAVAITVDRFEDGSRTTIIHATIHVEKAGQRGILIGKGGSKLKELGTAARERIETLLGRRVHLELFVRVSPRWKSVPRQLAELGYEAVAGTAPDLESSE